MLAAGPGANPSDVPVLPVPSSSRYTTWLSAALITAVILGAFASGLRTPFQYDDLSTVVENVTIRDLSAIRTVLNPVADVSPTAGRPVLNISFAVDYAVAGLNVVEYHSTNIALHVLCALLLCAVVRATLHAPVTGKLADRANVIAVTVAAIWAVHPLQSGAVTYISGRSDVLVGMWFVATLYAAIRAQLSAHRRVWVLATIVACAIGMASKESMVTAPIAVLLYDRAYFYRRFSDAFAQRWRLYAGLAATWVIAAALASQAPRSESAGFSTAISPWTYLVNQALVIPEYFRLVVWPDYLLFAYGASRQITLADVGAMAVVVPILIGASIWLWFRRPALGFPALWVFLTLAPTSSIIPIATEAGAARRMYLPLAGIVVLFVIAVATSIARWQHRARPSAVWTAAIGASVVIALATTTAVQGSEFASPERLWRGSLERWPSALAHRNLAAVLLQEGRRAEGADELRAAAELNPLARYSLGVELFEQGRSAEAIVELRRAILEFPDNRTIALEGRRVLGRALQQQGRHLEAADVFGEVARMTPGDVAPMLSRADELLAGGNLPAAHEAYQRLLQAHPGHFGAMTNDGLALLRMGRVTDALPLLRAVAEKQPQNVNAAMNLASAFSVAGRLADAAAAVCHAIALDPRNPAPRQFLADLRAAATAARLSPPQCQEPAAR